MELSPEDSLVLSVPMTVIWLPEASTGAVAPSPVWLPETVPSSPAVVPARRPSRSRRWTCRPMDSLVLSVPMTVTWLPEASTGAVAPASVWLPEPVPS